MAFGVPVLPGRRERAHGLATAIRNLTAAIMRFMGRTVTAKANIAVAFVEYVPGMNGTYLSAKPSPFVIPAKAGIQRLSPDSHTGFPLSRE